MRIEAYNQVAQIYNSNKVNGMKKTADVGVARDEVQISSWGRDYQTAKQAVAEASDIREDKVAQLAAKLTSGEYNIDPDDFASKLLEKYNALTM